MNRKQNKTYFSTSKVMGILNLSDNSFYDGGKYNNTKKILIQTKKMINEGANIIDIGGMSTAPYLKTIVSEKTESERITKTIKIIQNLSNIPISVDTCRASVAKDALELGIDVINDISGLKYDRNMPKIVEKYDHSLILNANSPHVNLDLASFEKVYHVPYQPTSENLVNDFAQIIKNSLPKDIELFKVVLSETATSFAEWNSKDQ